ALAVHGEIEDAAGGAVGMVEGQARLVEPHLQHPRLIGDLHSAASENKRPLWHSRLPPIRSTTERHYPVPADPALAVARSLLRMRALAQSGHGAGTATAGSAFWRVALRY